MDLNKIAVFVRVIDSGSFTQAARFLRQPKSRVSRRIAALEKDLGVALLYRTTRQFNPTEAGRTLYEQCRQQVYALESAAQTLLETSQEVTGVLRLTAVEDLGSVLLGPLITELRKNHPKVTVDLQLSNSVIDLVKEGFDLAIRIGNLEDTTLKSRLVGHVSFILVASPEYLRRAPRIETLSQLSQHPTLVFNGESEDSSWKLTLNADSNIRPSLRKFESVRVTPLCRSNHPRVLLDLALAGQGIALIPEFLCMDGLRMGTLKRVLRPYATLPLPIQFVWPAQRNMSPKVRAFINCGIEMLTKYFN